MEAPADPPRHPRGALERRFTAVALGLLLVLAVTARDLLTSPVDLDQANCVAAVSVNALEGLYVPRSLFAPLRTREPMARIGYSIYLFDLRHHER
jgi:hypothetical protein